jgi:uncharacterized protein (DUF362 family)
MALDLIAPNVAQSLKGKRRLMIKPNFVSTSKQLAATHVDAVRALLDFLVKHYSGRLTVAEGPSASRLHLGLRNFNYLKLKREYGVEFVDLNEDDSVEVEVWDEDMNKIGVRVAKTVIESDYRISVTPPKTHDLVIVTISIKNMVVGSLAGLRNKSRIHQGYKAMNLNIAKIAKLVLPHLSVIDGFEGMDGNGPVSGEPVNLRIAIAGLDALAVDATAARVMGFDPLEVGYFYHLNNLGVGVADSNSIEMLGIPIQEATRRFKPHYSYRAQMGWKLSEKELKRLVPP